MSQPDEFSHHWFVSHRVEKHVEFTCRHCDRKLVFPPGTPMILPETGCVPQHHWTTSEVGNTYTEFTCSRCGEKQVVHMEDDQALPQLGCEPVSTDGA